MPSGWLFSLSLLLIGNHQSLHLSELLQLQNSCNSKNIFQFLISVKLPLLHFLLLAYVVSEINVLFLRPEVWVYIRLTTDYV